MRCRPILLLGLGSLVLLSALPAHAQYATLETQNLRLIYRTLLDAPLAPYTAQCFENSLLFYRRVFRYEPSEKVTVMLQDWYDFNNGSAFAAPRNTVLVQIAPPSMVYETLPSNERINHTMNHEMAHIVALDRPAGSERFFRRLFAGKVASSPDHPETILYNYVTQPRFAAPRWYHEGIASFLETWMAGGIGRAKGAWDEMVFRAMVADSTRFYDPLGLESEGTKVEFQMGAMSYLYGTRFLTYMAYVTSPESLVAWAGRTPGSKRYYASQFRRVFGMSLGEAWRQWVAWEHEFQQANLDSLRRYPLTPYRDVSTRALGSVSRPFLDREHRTLYVGVTYPGVVGHIAAISLDDGAVRRICDVKGPALYFVTSLAYDPDSRTLFYTGDNGEWRDLYRLDPLTGKSERLITNGRIGDLVFDRSDGALWGVRHFNGISTLVRIPPPYRHWNQVHSWPYGQDVYDLDLSPDGRWLSFARSEISGRHSLHLLAVDDLWRGAPESRELYHFDSSLPANFIFSEDGSALYGSSYFTGVSNIWRYDLADSSMAAMSNSETGFFRPLPLGGDSLLVFRYSGAGFVPARVTLQPLEDLGAITFLGQKVDSAHPVLWDWNVGSPAKIPIDSLVQQRGDYHGVRALGLESIVPVVEGYKNQTALGLSLRLSDPGFRNALDATVSVSPWGDLDEEERVHANLGFRHLGWELRFKANGADFYDLFGPTKTSRKGYALGLDYQRQLIYDRPRSMGLHVGLAGYTKLETLPYAQNVFATSEELLTFRLDLEYKNVKRSMGAVDGEKGHQWSLLYANNTVPEASFNGVEAGFDFGLPFLVKHSSLWLRSALGYSPGDRDDPFANFYFGGFGNNYVDHRTEKRYRESYSFPGVDLNAVGGTNFARALLEWNLPPLRFQRLGKPSLYATWLRPALFSTALVTNMDSDTQRSELLDVGVQLDLQLVILARLQMMLSVGYAAAFAEDRHPADELMLSLKVL